MKLNSLSFAKLFGLSWPKNLNDNKHAKIEKVKKHNSSLRKEKFLMIAYFDPEGLSTIKDNVLQWIQKSSFKFDLINLFYSDNSGGLMLPETLNLKKYNGIVIHCTVAYNINNLLTLDTKIKVKFEDYAGLKILMKQDEQYKPHLVSEFIRDKGFDLIVSVAPKEILPILYPYQKQSLNKFIHSYTGYISEEMLGLDFPVKRSLDLVYRGSIQPFIFGRLGYEKKWIGDQFIDVCTRKTLLYDISSKWEDRIFGDRWFQFLGSSKGTIGVESGSSIVDFDGKIEAQYNEFAKNHPNLDFEAAYLNFLKNYDGNLQYRALAPRHFEAIITKTAQLLVYGKYSDVLIPNRHYFSLNADLSNVDEIIDQFMDDSLRKRMTDCAYEEIGICKKYQYSTFIETIDSRIEEYIK